MTFKQYHYIIADCQEPSQVYIHYSLCWGHRWLVSLEQEILILCPLVEWLVMWRRSGEVEQHRREVDRWRWEGEGQAEEE